VCQHVVSTSTLANGFAGKRCRVLPCVAVCCSMLQYVAACCSVLQCVAVCCNVVLLRCIARKYSVDFSVWCFRDCCTHTHVHTHSNIHTTLECVCTRVSVRMPLNVFAPLHICVCAFGFDLLNNLSVYADMMSLLNNLSVYADMIYLLNDLSVYADMMYLLNNLSVYADKTSVSIKNIGHVRNAGILPMSL